MPDCGNAKIIEIVPQNGGRRVRAIPDQSARRFRQDILERVVHKVVAMKGTVNQNLEPRAKELSTPISPFINSTRRFDIERPKPVPPYLRDVEPSP